MTSRLDAVQLHAHDPDGVARFWAELLRWTVDVSHAFDVAPPDDSGFRLRVLPTSEQRSGLNKVHLHLTSTSDADQQAVIERALALGGVHRDVGQLPDEGHVVLADPDGNEFCVIEAGNSFLAGCGFLGEVACDGSREVGLFWSNALDWPLVWDQDQETAIQSPAGGTKIAWGGPPYMSAKDRGGMHFDLVTADDLSSEVERLVALGATRVPDRVTDHVPDQAEVRWTVLADPDGNEFRVALV